MVCPLDHSYTCSFVAICSLGTEEKIEIGTVVEKEEIAEIEAADMTVGTIWMAADQIVGTAIKTTETLGITEIGTIETMNMATVITEKTKEETMIKSMEKPCKFLMYLYLSDVCLAECSSVLLVSSDDAVFCFLLNSLTVSRSGLLSD